MIIRYHFKDSSKQLFTYIIDHQIKHVWQDMRKSDSPKNTIKDEIGYYIVIGHVSNFDKIKLNKNDRQKAADIACGKVAVKRLISATTVEEQLRYIQHVKQREMLRRLLMDNGRIPCGDYITLSGSCDKLEDFLVTGSKYVERFNKRKHANAYDGVFNILCRS